LGIISGKPKIVGVNWMQEKKKARISDEFYRTLIERLTKKLQKLEKQDVP